MRDPSYRKYTKADIDDMARLWVKGVSLEDIAFLMGRSVRSIRWQIDKHRELFPQRIKRHKGDHTRCVVSVNLSITMHQKARLTEAAKRDRGGNINQVIRDAIDFAGKHGFPL